ncbi:galactoside permease [Peptococcaceae bacterium CEB3]|nr:galactoside permease [Peptococcaceae bacterium CEB3]
MQKSDLPRTIKILVAGGFVNSLGSALMWPLNSIFMHNVLGRTLTEAGMVIALQSGMNLLGQFISGFLADFLGARKMMLLGLTGSALIVTLIGLFPIWPVYAPGIILFGLMNGFVFVPLNTLVQTIWPEGGRRGFNYLYVLNNAGNAVGTALGGLVAQISFRWVFLGNAISFIIYFMVVVFAIRAPAKVQKMPEKRKNHSAVLHAPGSPALLALAMGILLVWGGYSQWTTIVPVIMTQRGFSLPFYSFLWTLNGIFIVALQPLTNWIIRVWAYGFRRQFYLACFLIACSFLALRGHLPYAAYLLGMLSLTLGEMLILPAVPAAAAFLAPQGWVGTYQGIVGGAASGGRMLGPVLGGIVFDRSHGSQIWLLALVFVSIGLLAFIFYGFLENRFRRTSDSSLKI